MSAAHSLQAPDMLMLVCPHLMRGSLALQARKFAQRVLGSSAAHSRQMLQVCLGKRSIPLQHGRICLYHRTQRASTSHVLLSYAKH